MKHVYTSHKRVAGLIHMVVLLLCIAPQAFRKMADEIKIKVAAFSSQPQGQQIIQGTNLGAMQPVNQGG